MAFDIARFNVKRGTSVEYQRQLERLHASGKHSRCIEDAVDGAVANLRQGGRSFVIYWEPQSGKTEMMICRGYGTYTDHGVLRGTRKRRGSDREDGTLNHQSGPRPPAWIFSAVQP
jgi:hypothetical protein